MPEGSERATLGRGYRFPLGMWGLEGYSWELRVANFSWTIKP
jgi:hypothetical protein